MLIETCKVGHYLLLYGWLWLAGDWSQKAAASAGAECATYGCFRPAYACNIVINDLLREVVVKSLHLWLVHKAT
jgi:hypothetical protein